MKKTLVLILAVLMAVSCFSAQAITLETVEVAAEKAQNAEAEGAALAESNVVPGINVFTGTKEPNPLDTKPSALGGAGGAVSHGVFDDNGNNVYRWEVAVESGEKYPNARIDVKIENGRKYYYSANTKMDGTNASGDLPYWILYSDGSEMVNFASKDTDLTAALKAGLWYPVSETFTAKKDSAYGTLQMKVKNAPSTSPCYYYFDDMMLVPYYKIEYIGLDGETTVTTVDYLFLGEDVNNGIADVYVPDLALVEGATGFSLTPEGDAISYVTLENRDVTLYARNDVAAATKTIFTYGKEVYEATVTGEKFILPYNTTTDFDIAEGEYLNFWTDGKNYYYPGEVLNASEVQGKVFCATVNDFSLFDEKKGYLMYRINFEDGGSATKPKGYKNAKYGYTSFAKRTDYISSQSIIEDTDGDYVLKDVNRKAGYHMTGYRADKAHSDLVGSRATYEFDVKYIDCISRYKSLSIRMCYGTGDSEYNMIGSVAGQAITDKKDNEWIHVKVYNTAAKGYMGGFLQYGVSNEVETTVYFDDFEAWALPDIYTYFKSSRNAEDWVKFPVDKTVETFTMPTPVEAGFGEIENFLAWTDGKNLYEAGKAYARTDLKFKMLYPFVQDVNEPAVISLFEGDVDKSVSKTKLTEPVIDDGRTALMVAYWGDTWNGKSYDGDPRMTLSYPARFDASKYTVIAAMTKIDYSYKADSQTVGTTCTANSTGSFQIFNYINSQFSYNANSAITSWSYNTDGKYHYKEIDMATQASSATYPWIDTGWGFTFDVVRETYGGRAFIDYVRVYKDGLNTVTYDTNAPAGVAKENIGNVDAETGNIAPDTGRGLGTGYLLKDDRPVVPGYKFAGWALTPDAGVEDVIESFDFIKDTTVYAVWVKDNGAINARTGAEMKFGSTTTGSIRFKADVLNAQVEDADEYGFIVARKSHLDTYSEELTHSFIYRTKKAFTPLYVEGVAYQYDREADEVLVNRIYEKDEATGDVIYTALCTNIPLNENGINDKLVARPYYKYSLNGKTVYVYGTAAEASLGDVASAVDKESEQYTDNKDYIDGILAVYETTAE